MSHIMTISGYISDEYHSLHVYIYNDKCSCC